MAANVKVTNGEFQTHAVDGATHHQVTVSDTAGTLQTLGSFAFNAKTRYVLIEVKAQPARITFDGATDPTATLGYDYPDGTRELWHIKKAKDAILVREGGSDSTVEVQEMTHSG